MKRLSVFIALYCLLVLIGCAQVQRPKPWKLNDQDPMNIGFMFMKMKPTVKYSPGGLITCMSMWSLSGAKSNETGEREGGLIETQNLMDGRYFIYPLKPGLYMMGYAIGMIGTGSKMQIPYTLTFEIKPGEVAYLGHFTPIDEFKYSQSFDKHSVLYHFEKMDITDDYVTDIKWASNRIAGIFSKFQPKNYYPEIREVKK